MQACGMGATISEFIYCNSYVILAGVFASAPCKTITPDPSTGDAMSPPVLGTIMALCMLYILPATNEAGSAPLLSPHQVVSHTVTHTVECSAAASSDSDLELSDSSADTDTVVVEPHSGPMAARLPDDIKNGGLFGVNVKLPSRFSDHCDHCKEKFQDDDVIYMWRCRHASVILCFHEHCVLLYSEEHDAHHWTLVKVKELLQECGPRDEALFESLFRVEADLTSMAVWNIDDPSEDSGLEGWTEKPAKLRRC